MLGDIEDRHGDIKGVGDQKDGNPHFDEVLEEAERIAFVQVVLFGDHRDQFVTEHESDDHPRDGDDDRLGEGADHAEDIAVPALRGLPDLFRDRGRLLIHIGKHRSQIGFDQSDKELTDSLLDLV